VVFKALWAAWKPRFTSKFTNFWSVERCTSLMQQSLEFRRHRTVHGFSGLDDFRLKPPPYVMTANPHGLMPTGQHDLSASDLWTIYDTLPPYSVGVAGVLPNMPDSSASATAMPRKSREWK
jgi:hypothetical protein